MFAWHAIVNVCMASLHKMTESCHDGHVLGLFSVLLYTIVTRNQGFVSRWLSRCLKCGGCSVWIWFLVVVLKVVVCSGCGVWIWFRSLDGVVVLDCRFEGGGVLWTGSG